MNMRFIDEVHRFERLALLIRLENTGPPDELAKTFNVTPRTLYRLLDDMKEVGAPICYDKKRQSYYYKNEGKFIIRFEYKTEESE
jgi:predicted DNA-binding transcriptional regulator YafY